ncbi:hypothetical protein D6833_13075 [Candidatus Parcubacteria bacterium]|nr:MAG: hypothetical protein D6833_13075 [Candidatus Parcubacteria bacterium]
MERVYCICCPTSSEKKGGFPLLGQIRALYLRKGFLPDFHTRSQVAGWNLRGGAKSGMMGEK